MARAKAKKKLPWQWIAGGGADEEDENKLPPLEAFSFKSIMSDMQGDDDVNADLDRIAEICARSRYSLSNQYEVHVAPHGSGASFVAVGHGSSSRRRRDHHQHRQRQPHNHHHGPPRGEAGPTLQAVPSDDDESGARTHRKRRSGGRRKSMAYGTLETIMSSSRSSEEDKSKKPPAAEIADEVRGRARKGSDPPAGSGSGSTTKAEAGGEPGDDAAARSKSKEGPKKPARKKSTSFAHAVIIDSTRHAGGAADAAQPRNSASALVSGPALPQTSSSHFGVRTAPDAPPYQDAYREAHPPESPSESGTESPLSEGLPHLEDPTPSGTGLLSGFHAWVPWRNNGTGPQSDQRGTSQASHAAGSLRELLKTAEGKQSKGKGVDRDG